MPFKKGKSGNPKGRPRKGNSALEALEKAIRSVEKKKKKKLFAHFVEKAYEDEKVLVALVKKVVPDLRHYEHDHTHDLAEELRKAAFKVFHGAKRKRSN